MKRFLPAERWRILALTVIMQAITMGSTSYVFALFVQPWMVEFDLGRREVLSGITVFLISCGLWSAPSGSLMSRYPARYMVALGLLVMAAGLACVAFSNSMTMIILSYVVVIPLGTTLSGPLGAMSLIARNFDGQRGLAMGIGTLGTSIGGVIMPLAVSRMLPEAGWRDTFLALALLSAAFAPAAFLVLLRENLHDGRASKGAAAKGGWRNYLGQRNFWVIVAAYLLGWMTYSSLQNNIGPYGAEIGISPAQTGVVLAVFSVAMVIGKLATGALSDMLDNRWLFAAGSVMVASAGVILMVWPSYYGVLAAFAVMGTGTGSYLPLKGAMCAACFGPQAVGRAMGLTAPFITLFAVGPFLAGWVRDVTGSYDIVFAAAVAVSLATIPLIFLLRPTAQAAVSR